MTSMTRPPKQDQEYAKKQIEEEIAIGLKIRLGYRDIFGC
jgi:hypothetical protein